MRCSAPRRTRPAWMRRRRRSRARPGPACEICAAQAAPVACGMPAATIPDVPRKPFDGVGKMHRAPDPFAETVPAPVDLGHHRLRIGPPGRADSRGSGRSRRTGPCGPRVAIDPTMDASAPSARCVWPRITPGWSMNVRLTRSSNSRMRSICSYIQTSRSRSSCSTSVRCAHAALLSGSNWVAVVS